MYLHIYIYRERYAYLYICAYTGFRFIHIYMYAYKHMQAYMYAYAHADMYHICMHVGFLLPAEIQVSAGLSIQSNLFELALQAPTIHTPSQNTNLQVMLHN